MSDDPVCITCGDVALATRVLAIGDDGVAECATADGVRSAVEIGLVDDVDVGDTVLVHAGVALQRLDEEPVA
jgi:hydrogenase maturation factor